MKIFSKSFIVFFSTQFILHPSKIGCFLCCVKYELKCQGSSSHVDLIHFKMCICQICHLLMTGITLREPPSQKSEWTWLYDVVGKNTFKVFTTTLSFLRATLCTSSFITESPAHTIELLWEFHVLFLRLEVFLNIGTKKLSLNQFVCKLRVKFSKQAAFPSIRGRQG